MQAYARAGLFSHVYRLAEDPQYACLTLSLLSFGSEKYSLFRLVQKDVDTHIFKTCTVSQTKTFRVHKSALSGVCTLIPMPDSPVGAEVSFRVP